MAELEIVHATGRIEASPETVWAYLGDPERMVHLNQDLIEVRDISPAGALQAGQRWIERSRTPLGEQELRTRVVAVDGVDRHVRLESHGPMGVCIEGGMHLRPSGSGTEVVLEHRITLPGGPLFSGAVAALLAGRVRQNSRAALERLAAGVQARKPGVG